MADLEELGKFLKPFLGYLKNMELELTCPLCSFVLRHPMLLPCNHIVCSQCVPVKNQYQYECPVCISTFLYEDLRHFMHMEKMIDIFNNLDKAMVSVVEVLHPQVIEVPAMVCPFSDQSGKEEKSQDSKFDKSDKKLRLLHKENPLSGNECAKEKSKEEVECDDHGGITNAVSSNIPTDGGGNGEMSSFAEIAGQDHHINREEPFIPPILCDLKISETNDDQRSAPDAGGVSMDGLPIKEKQVKLFALTDPPSVEAQYTRISNDAESSMSVSSAETSDDVREAKRQKLNNEHKSDCDDTPPDTYGHTCTEGSVKCAFCHLSKITEFTGPIAHYVNGKSVGPEELNQSKVRHFHRKCFEWAPLAFFEGEIAMNIENELARASKIKCSQCGQKGASLVCYVGCCLRSYHLPCAVALPCRWDLGGFNMLCPSHSSCKFPYELEWGIKANHSLRPHDKSKARKSIQYSAQLDNSNFPEEQRDEAWIAEPGVCVECVLCGSDLPTPEMELLRKFAGLTGASVAGMWKPNVTHVIASTDKNGACNRTQTFLMAILSGNWVVTVDWIKASMAARFPVSEEAYEVVLDCYGIPDGPRKGRMRANQKEPKIFTGLGFYFSELFSRLHRRFLEEIVLAAGGTVLKNVDLVTEESKAGVFSLGSSFIVYNEDPPQCKSANLEEVANKRCDEVEALVLKTGFKVIGHMRLLDHVAACSSAAELENAAIQAQ